jgi:hypothetical protein
VQVQGLATGTGAANTDIVWYAKEVTKPSFTVNVAEHAYLNHKFKFPGTVTWNDIDLTVVDPQHDVDAAEALSSLWADSGYSVPAAPGGAGTGALATDSKAFCKGITYGDAIAYGNDELTTYKLSIVYDFAEMLGQNNTFFAPTTSTTTP